MVTLNFQKYKIQQQVHIYIYAFIYVGYTEKQDVLSAVSCSLVTAMNLLLY